MEENKKKYCALLEGNTDTTGFVKIKRSCDFVFHYSVESTSSI